MNNRYNTSLQLKNQVLSLVNEPNIDALGKVELLKYIDQAKKVIRALYSQNLIIT